MSAPNMENQYALKPKNSPTPPPAPESGIITEEGWSRAQALEMAQKGETQKSGETLNDRITRWKSEMAGWSYGKLNKFLEQCEANINKRKLAVFKDDLAGTELDAIKVLQEKTFHLIKDKKMPTEEKADAKKALSNAENILASQLKNLNSEIESAKKSGRGATKFEDKKRDCIELSMKITDLKNALNAL